MAPTWAGPGLLNRDLTSVEKQGSTVGLANVKSQTMLTTDDIFFC